MDAGLFNEEIVPSYPRDQKDPGGRFRIDEHVRPDTKLADLASSRPPLKRMER